MTDYTLEDAIRDLKSELAALDRRDPRTTRRGSRFVREGADPGLVEHIARGGEVRVAEPGYKAGFSK